MIPDWISTFASGAAGAFIAAWVGAYLGFRRSKRERALDRRIGWHESTIQSLAQYEEQLERLHGYFRNVLIVQRPRDDSNSIDPANKIEFPTHIKVPATIWSDLRDAESSARSALRVGDIYAEGRAKVDCAVALSNSVNTVSGQWLDMSTEPLIPWAELARKVTASADLRRSLQDSLTIVLELDGILGRILGAKYRKWQQIRILKRLIAENERKAAKLSTASSEHT